MVRPLPALIHLALALALALGAARAADDAAPAAPSAGPPPKVLRVSFRIAETGFDPTRVSDLYSRTILAHILEPLYRYDHLARPARFHPLTAAAMPEVSDDYRTWTIRIRPGIYFADDPAFNGKRRELVAEDYVYSMKRFADPSEVRPMWTFVEGYKILGLADLYKQAMANKKPFEYDRPIAGLKALDRYTLQIKLAAPRLRFVEFLASELNGAVAREVVEKYRDDVAAHPVGTGPFKLGLWRRASQINLDRNPDYRERYYDNEPAPGDAEGEALAARFKGRRLPLVDRVEVSIIEENQPRWLAFVNGQTDLLEEVAGDFINIAMPGGKPAPNLAKRGIQGYRIIRADMATTVFNMEHPVIGGYTPEQVALRRAISLGIDVDREIRLVRRNQAIRAQANLVPHTSGYDPAYKSEMGDYDVPRAKALLDLYGYVDRDGDGWRERPDGSPLLLEWATEPDQQSRQLAELSQRNMNALQIRVQFVVRKWPENLKNVQAGKFMIWAVGSLASSPDGQDALARMHGPQGGGQNLARFKNAQMDAIYDRLSRLPDGPEREALFLQAKKIGAAWMPYKVRIHRYINDLAHPRVIGYRRPLFWQDFWQYVDIDESARAKAD